VDTFEDCLHVLRECHFAKLIWNIFIPTEHQSAFYSLAFTDWLCSNASCKDLKFGFDCQWRTTFCAIAWNIRVWRCRAVFDGDFLLPHDPNRRIANDVEIAVSAFYSKKTEPSMKVTKFLAWEFPSVQIKKKIGMVLPRGTKTCMVLPRDIRRGAGGLLRDCSGTSLCGYTWKIPQPSPRN